MKKTCYDCGKEKGDEKGWKICPHCNEPLCPTCGERASKEKRDIERLQFADPEERLQILCPSCTRIYDDAVL